MVNSPILFGEYLKKNKKQKKHTHTHPHKKHKLKLSNESKKYIYIFFIMEVSEERIRHIIIQSSNTKKGIRDNNTTKIEKWQL